MSSFTSRKVQLAYNLLPPAPQEVELEGKERSTSFRQKKFVYRDADNNVISQNDYNEMVIKPTELLMEVLSIGRKSDRHEKFEAFQVLLEKMPDRAIEILNRWRDGLKYFKGDDEKMYISLISDVVKKTTITSQQKLTTASTLYNLGYLDSCWELFQYVATSDDVEGCHRVDAARYLYSRGDDEAMESAQNVLLDIIGDHSYDTEWRYSIVASFIGKTGINSVINAQKIYIPQDDDFVYTLQVQFFYDERNAIEERLLSGQYLLQLGPDYNTTVEEGCPTKQEKVEIGDKILAIAKNEEYSPDRRADAADIVSRCGIEDQKVEARKVIKLLGDIDNVNHSTVYTDAQNIHSFTDQINKALQGMMNDTSLEIEPYSVIYDKIGGLVSEHFSNNTRSRFRAKKALYRISIDTAKFTDQYVTLSGILEYVWAKIKKSEHSDELTKRLLEELADMGETCSSGHAGRFVNVLSAYDNNLTISWEDQIKANIVGRMNARIRDAPDDIRDHLVMAKSELADDEDKKVYDEFIDRGLEELWDILKQEFVDGGHTTLEVFTKAFQEGKEGF